MTKEELDKIIAEAHVFVPWFPVFNIKVAHVNNYKSVKKYITYVIGRTDEDGYIVTTGSGALFWIDGAIYLTEILSHFVPFDHDTIKLMSLQALQLEMAKRLQEIKQRDNQPVKDCLNIELPNQIKFIRSTEKIIKCFATFKDQLRKCDYEEKRNNRAATEEPERHV